MPQWATSSQELLAEPPTCRHTANAGRHRSPGVRFSLRRNAAARFDDLSSCRRCRDAPKLAIASHKPARRTPTIASRATAPGGCAIATPRPRSRRIAGQRSLAGLVAGMPRDRNGDRAHVPILVVGVPAELCLTESASRMEIGNLAARPVHPARIIRRHAFPRRVIRCGVVACATADEPLPVRIRHDAWQGGYFA